MFLSTLQIVFFLGSFGLNLFPVCGTQISSCAEKFKVIDGHSACLSDKLETLPQSDIDLIVKMHNDVRSQVNPSASNMLQMTWDAELAMIAQRLADSCSMEHDSGIQRMIPGKFLVGQNIAVGEKSWQTVISNWESEKNDFQFGNPNDFTKIQRYTLMVSAETNKIGCGFAKCAQNFHVCNYGPAGRLNFNSPYVEGTPCDKCKNCVGGKLCDCGLTCLNLGRLDLTTCSCKCRMNWPFYVFENCSLDCSRGKSDTDACQTNFGSNPCSLIGFDCPNRCKFCPYASFDADNSKSKADQL